MKAWKRVGPSTYRSGEFWVGRLACGEWYAEGPGVDAVFPTKAEAQAACSMSAVADG